MILEKHLLKGLAVTLAFSSLLIMNVAEAKRDNATNSVILKDSQQGTVVYFKPIVKPIVKLKNGQFEGKIDEKHHVKQWLGIPYAKAPTGKLRWKEPKKLSKSEEVYDATKPGQPFVQFAGGKTVGSENALTLDVYRPDTSETNLPVLVFLHGGNNQNSHSRLIQGEKFASEANAIFVSVQYRLGVLGFNNLPAVSEGNDYEKSGNYTLLDQAMALEWVQKNIANFGGNPKNVTVSGFSAGGRDVMAMLISPVFKKKFDKAISFSGGLTVADPEASRKVIAKALAPLAVADNMIANEKEAFNWFLSNNKKDKKEVKKYLNAIDSSRLAPLMGSAAIRMSVFPHLFADGKVLPKEGFNTKKLNDVPLLMLASSSEFNSFSARDKYFAANVKNKKILTNETIRKEFEFANKYGNTMYGFFNGQEGALTLANHYDAPIYICEFAYGKNADVVGEEFAVINGAVHGIFMPFLSEQGYPFTRQYPEVFNSNGSKDLSKQFIAAIAAFMRSGNPNGSLPVHWEEWTKENRTELVFDADKDKAIITLKKDKTSYEKILKELEKDNSISEVSKKHIIENVLNGRWFSSELDKKYGNCDLWNILPN